MVERLSFISLTASALFLCFGCSVLEQRGECPCIVEVSLDSAIGLREENNMGACTVALFMNDTEGRRQLSDNILLEEGCEPMREEIVKRDRYRIGAILASDYGRYVRFADGMYTIPVGMQPDSVYGFTSELNAMLDTAMVNLDMGKQFSTVTFLSPSPGLFDDYILKIRGNVSSLKAVGLEPVEGEFECTVGAGADARHSFRMPRQKDDSIVLQLLRKGETLPSIILPLGGMIMATGYDFRAPDLKDVEVMLDLNGNRAVVSVEGWKDEWIYRIF